MQRTLMRRRLAWGAAVALAGIGAVLVATSLGGSGPGREGAVRPVDAGARNRTDVTAHNSPTLVANPTRPANLVVVNRVDSPLFSCAVHISFDGGRQWEPGRLPFPAGEEDPPRCFAPDAAFGPDGRLYVSFVTLAGPGNVPHAGWTTTSTDGGRSFGAAARLTGPLGFQLRVAADPERAGRVWASWLQASGTGTLSFPDTGNPVMVARSDDGGTSWSAPVRASAATRARVVAPSIASGAGGDVYVLYLDVGDDRLDYHGAHQGRGGEPDAGPWSLVLARSTDGGATWAETLVDGAVVPTERFIVFIPQSPSLAVDPARHRVYAAFHDGRDGDADVRVWASADDGGHFGPPARVNDNPVRDGTAQYLPRLAVAPGGRLDVAFYDRRDDRADHRNEVSLQSSSDAGRSFGPRVAVSDRSFDAGIGFGSERGLPDLGSRLALVSDADRARVVWTDTRAGTVASGKQDLAVAVVRLRQGAGFRFALGVLGVVAVLAGATVALGPLARSLSVPG
ncbi:MAG: sialidase family protein [Acidimicrobiales bacterium]